jgi:hypothetical protein
MMKVARKTRKRMGAKRMPRRNGITVRLEYRKLL